MVAAEYKLRVGLLGIGLEAYWSQFAGLEDRLKEYVAEVAGFVRGNERTVVNFGLLDTPEKALATSHACRREDIDVLLVYCTTSSRRYSEVVFLLLQFRPLPHPPDS